MHLQKRKYILLIIYIIYLTNYGMHLYYTAVKLKTYKEIIYVNINVISHYY